MAVAFSVIFMAHVEKQLSVSLIRKRWSSSGEQSLRSVVNAVGYIVLEWIQELASVINEKRSSVETEECFRSIFFSLPLIFTLHWWPLGFLIFSPPLQNFHVVFPTRNESPLFFISRSRSLLPFFSLSFAGLSPTFSFSLSFSSSTFQICGHEDTDTETISAFRFRLDWLFSCLCFKRRGWLCDFPPK